MPLTRIPLSILPAVVRTQPASLIGRDPADEVAVQGLPGRPSR
ncbi:hypothetical protein BH20ACT3_BH20ACT3_07670 [soil metagenome]